MTLQNRLADFILAVGTDYKQIRTWITGSSTGSLTALNTSAKTSLVDAINEINARPTGVSADATETNKGVVELASLAEVAAGVDTLRVVTPAGVRQERLALREEILGSGVPEALDTLDELAAALGDDANFASTITSALASRVRTDVDDQGLTTQQQANARANISVYSKAEIGDVEADLVAAYNAAKS